MESRVMWLLRDKSFVALASVEAVDAKIPQGPPLSLVTSALYEVLRM